MGTPTSSASHNKYCHFCQHVKVRASSMLACSNTECSRRFCEHCLLTHLAEDVDPSTSDAWINVNGKNLWQCPICRKRCCCSVSNCTATHRHCKAYRYRRRRAELGVTFNMSSPSWRRPLLFHRSFVFAFAFLSRMCAACRVCFNDSMLVFSI